MSRGGQRQRSGALIAGPGGAGRGRVRAALGLAAILLLPAACGRPPRNPAPARHVIVISLDTTRADHCGFLGSTKGYTPQLDSLARESIVYTDYMTVVPTTLASHTSLFTGRYPHHHGTPRNGFMINGGNEMLPDLLHRAGFRTAGFAASFALDARFGFARGFDHYDQDFDLLVGEGGVDQNQRRAREVTDAVLRYLDREGVPPRLFLFVHYFDPHAPYAAPPPFDHRYDPRGREGLATLNLLHAPSFLGPAEKDSLADRYARQYAAEISYMDAEVGRLLGGLRQRRILDDALLIVTSDHGETLWDHPEEAFDHGLCVFQSTVRAVCLLRLPRGLHGGLRVSRLLANIDILPTILRYLGLKMPAGVDGEPEDLTAPGTGPGERLRFSQATKPWAEVETDPRWTNLRKARCVREGPFKFVQTPYLGTEALFDLSRDPEERDNLLAAPNAEIRSRATRLRRKLEAWAASAHPLPSRFEPSQREETIRRLRSLGYMK